MNYYTVNSGIKENLVSVEDDIETLSTAVTGLTTVMNAVPTDTKLVDQALTISGGATPSLTMTNIACTGARSIAIQVNNKGAATTVTVNIYGKIGTLEYSDVPEITAVTLNASTAKCDIIILGCGIALLPYDAVKVVIANTDATNATTVDAIVRVIV